MTRNWADAVTSTDPNDNPATVDHTVPPSPLLNGRAIEIAGAANRRGHVFGSSIAAAVMLGKARPDGAAPVAP